MTVRILRSRRVICEATIELPLSAGTVWGQLRDFRAAAMHDPFHSRIQIDGVIPRVGAKLMIEHRYLFWKTTRIGRILRWTEGSGFAFSDLCRTNVSRAFPHEISYQLEPINEKTSRLLIRVGGRWTADGTRWIGRIWLWWVFSQMVRCTENELLRFAVTRRKTILF